MKLRIVQEIKEKFCAIALDYDQEIKNPVAEESYELPNGQVIKIGHEKFLGPECLFRPLICRNEGSFCIYVFFLCMFLCY